ncbi:FMNH2-dependent monooxygenase [Mycolicibacterium chubuense]|uniref:Putative monooxygenase MoxC n=1 Tax=Mycolicibacterium chubuense TaxID=1800 RepID=A0A0J6VQ27_MYCCU|nr:LLM class flavin-dependent oxidoreductase [Mycolicibacterium chubuense]KMO73160.1 putative monooxygenase MoxC [Mycolicibacterium chubuense]ORA43073.1 FMNH2-dependent monooxygenase [Mycolicibacterium chubuense]SPX98697.1 fmnh2-utilizing oxygenase [Mycolicibacterium chubuense]
MTALHLAVGLSGTGRHPASWREPDASPAALTTAAYWVDVITEAERGGIGLVTLDDALTLQPDGVQGRVDAVLTAARVAPRTQRIGLLPTAVATHTEPFHLAKAIATLDYVSAGRAGLVVQVDASPEGFRHFGRRRAPERSAELYDEAADYVEVLRRLWDSWEDDAEIRDAATGRFVDRDKLHYIDFEGRWFSVKGPSITPRPPQGQPLVAAKDPGEDGVALAAGTDIVFLRPHTPEEVEASVVRHRTALTFVDLVVFLDPTAAGASARTARLDDQHGAEFTDPAAVFTGTPAQLADRLEQGHLAGATGFRLLPGTLPHDLTQITTALIPELHRRGVLVSPAPGSLREQLGLPRPTNRYAAAPASEVR